MLSRRSDEIEAGRTLRENPPAHGDGVGPGLFNAVRDPG
jgi:hypothetical protein